MTEVADIQWEAVGQPHRPYLPGAADLPEHLRDVRPHPAPLPPEAVEPSAGLPENRSKEIRRDGSALASVGDLFDTAEREGFAPPVIPKPGRYLVTIVSAHAIREDSLAYRLEIEHSYDNDSSYIHKVFDPYRLNWTPRGIRRAVAILKKWGIYPQPEDTTETIAAKLLGLQAVVDVEVVNLYGQDRADYQFVEKKGRR